MKSKATRSINTKKPHGIKREWVACYCFIAPLVIGIFAFSVFPLVYALGMSFTEWDGLGSPVFVGLRNFVELFKDKSVLYEMRNTFLYALMVVPTTIFLALLIANLLNAKIRGKGIFRTIYYLPNVTMAAAVAIVWRWLFNSDFGLINQLLKALGLPIVRWISDPKVALISVSIVSIWKNVGYAAMVILAGLQGIPQRLYEAAKIDGANSFHLMWNITVPMVTPTIFFILVTTLINTFKEFDIIYIFLGNSGAGQSGPLADALRTMVGGAYYRGFSLMKMGYASAEATVLFVFILIVTLVQFKLQKHWVNYDI